MAWYRTDVKKHVAQDCTYTFQQRATLHLRDVDDEVDLALLDVLHHVRQRAAVESGSGVATRPIEILRFHERLCVHLRTQKIRRRKANIPNRWVRYHMLRLVAIVARRYSTIRVRLVQYPLSTPFLAGYRTLLNACLPSVASKEKN